MSGFWNRKGRKKDRDRVIRDNMMRAVHLYPPDVVEQTRKEKGAEAARKTRIAIGLDWARKAGARIPLSAGLASNRGRAVRVAKRLGARKAQKAVSQIIRKRRDD